MELYCASCYLGECTARPIHPEGSHRQIAYTMIKGTAVCKPCAQSLTTRPDPRPLPRPSSDYSDAVREIERSFRHIKEMYDRGNPNCVRCSGGPYQYCSCIQACSNPKCGAKLPPPEF